MIDNEIRYVLILGDDEQELFACQEVGFLKDMLLNFEKSPSIAMIFDVDSRSVKDLIDGVRAKGMKAGVYSSLPKAQSFMFKSMSVSDDGTMMEPKMITLGEVNP